MKKLIALLLVLLLCLSYFVPAFAEDAPPEAAVNEETASAAAESTEASELPEAYLKWAHGGPYDDRGAFDRSFRQYYAADPDVEIINNMVFLKGTVNQYPSKETGYRLIDFFATDELERTVKTLRIPAEVNGQRVMILPVCQTNPPTDDPDDSVSNGTVTKVILNEGFTAVPRFAFRNFTALKTVRLPASVLCIERSAFENCKKLSKLLGGGVVQVETAAFKNCKKLTSFPKMENIVGIQGDAFYGCGFETLTLAGTLSIVGPTSDMDYYATSNAFANCKKLKDVTFLSMGKYPRLWIGAGAFRGCSALESVTFPKKTNGIHILRRAFQDCTKLKTLKNVGKLKTISNNPFARCTSLERFVLPEGIEMVAERPFKGCKNLRTLDIRSADIDLFGRGYGLYGNYYWGSTTGASEEVSSANFVKYLPKGCTVFVPTPEMQQIAQIHGCKNTIKVKK